MATTAQIEDLAALYAGYFNRAPDPAGLQFWIDQIDNGREFNTIAADFAASPEAEALYPYLTTPGVSSPAIFVTEIYANLFGRTPDAEGLAFWTGVLEAGTVSVADFIEEIILGAVDAPDATPPTFDKATLDNKVEAGLYWADSVANVPSFTYDSDAASAAAAALAGVTSDPATVTAANDSTDEYVSGGAGSGQSFTLTTGIDDITGTIGNDVFLAQVSEDGSGTDTSTINIGDKIDGGAGIDTLRIRQTDEPDDVDITNAPNIEILEYFTSDEDELYLSGMTEIQKIIVSDSSVTGNDFYGIQNLVDIEFRNNTDDVDGYFEFSNSVMAGDVTMTFNNNQDNAVDIEDFETEAGDSLIENLTVVNRGVNEDVSIDDLDIMETLTINGTGELYIGLNTEESLTSVDASGMAGDVEFENDFDLENDFTYTGAQGSDILHVEDDDAGGHTFIVNTGTGDDEVEVFEQDDNIVEVDLGDDDDILTVQDAGTLADTFESDDTYNGGDGTDRLRASNDAFAAAVAGSAANISNFEELGVSDVFDANFDVSVAFSAFNNISLDAGHDLSATLSGVNSGTTLTIAADSTASTLDVNVDGAAAGAADELNLVLTNDNDTNFGGIDTTDVETVNINADDGDDDADADHVANINGTGTETLVITGDAASLDLSGAALIDATSVDSTGFEGDLTLSLAGNTNDVTVTLGAGDDEVTSGDGGDTFTGGAGDDTYVYTAASQSTGANVDIIEDFTVGDDLIDLSAILGVAYGGEANGLAAANTALSGGANVVLDTSTNQIYVDVDASGDVNVGDMIIELTGISDLSQTDFV